MRRRVVVAFALFLPVAIPLPGSAQAKQAPFAAAAPTHAMVRKSAEAITASQLKDYLAFVASDEMEGRSTPSRGLDATAKFMATLLSRWGARPGGDGGTYLQGITLRKETVAQNGAELEVGPRRFVHGRDFHVAASAGTGAASGAMVFAGDGWFIGSKGIDAFQGIDPKGKVVVLTAGGLPKGITFTDLTGKQGVDWIDPPAYARQKGAVGVITLISLMAQANPDSLENARRSLESGTFRPERLPGPAQAQLPTVYVGAKAAEAIFASEKVDATTILMSTPGGPSIKPFELSPGKKVRFSVRTVSETRTSQNVVAIVEGSDPTLRNEYVALGAHYDHAGTWSNAPAGADAIFNGADDDGTGTVALLSIAEALLKAPKRPKRSVLFVWHMGEEMGLWGSEYFVTFPTVPVDRIVAQLNIDMIGRSRAEGNTDPRNKDLTGPNELYVIGSKMMSTELGELSEAVNRAYLKLSFNYRYDDPEDPERFFYRSDHIHYARRNIPVIFYFTGVHADYHELSDEVATIDFAKFERITRTILMTAWEIGDLKVRPRVDKELPPEARQGPF